MGDGGPPNKWYTILVSPRTDPAAGSSAAILNLLNEYQVPAAFPLTCSDGTFIFVGVYTQQ